MMIMLFLVWILPVNFYIQRYMQHQGQQNNTVEMFGLPEQLIAANTEELVIEEEEFKKGCIRATEAEDKLYTVFLYKKTCSIAWGIGEVFLINICSNMRNKKMMRY